MALNQCFKCSDGKSDSEFVKLKCEHLYCWVCMNEYIKSNISSKIKCPFQSCRTFIRDRMIRQVLSADDIYKYESVSLSKTNMFFCLLKECQNPVSYTDPSIQYECMKCSLINCISCKVPHELIKCADFKSKSKQEQATISKVEFEIAERVLSKRRADASRELLLEFEEINLLKNDEIFTCICDVQFAIGKGIKLQNCFHNICEPCLKNYITHCDTMPVHCPYCEFMINDREIKSVLSSHDFNMYHRRSKNSAIKHMNGIFQCKTPDCDNFCEITNDAVKEFKCTKCQIVNCVKCSAIHMGETCTQYQSRKSKTPSKPNNFGEVMDCPKCNTLLKKNKGCNWIQCSNCQVELCWIRKMLRWGPKGQGDISGGCRCMVDNKPCDDKCTPPYCTPHRRTLFQSNVA